MFEAVPWHAPAGVQAVVTTRAGGASAEPWSSLNLALHVGDVADVVTENRRRVNEAARLPAMPRWLRQVHGTVVADLDAVSHGEVPEADAAVTLRSGTVCAVLTADCLPVILATADGSVIAAAHAGWRGLAAGVLEATVAALRHRAGEDAAVVYWIGPGISARHFEVRDDVRDAFISGHAADATAFAPGRPGHWQCDLPALARRRLGALGAVDAGTAGDRCCYEEEARFYSHRRDVQHRGFATTGRFATLIWRQA